MEHKEKLKLDIRSGLTCYDSLDDDLYLLIDEIYNTIESRICKNCKFYHTLGCKENKPSWFCADFEKAT